MFTDNCFSSQDRGSGVNYNVIFDRWMSLQECHALINAKSAQCYTLVDFYMIPNFTGFTYNNAGTMINAKVFADLSGRMDIDAGLRMCIFRKRARKKWNILFQECMGYAIKTYSHKPGICSNYFEFTPGSRVPIYNGSYIGI